MLKSLKSKLLKFWSNSQTKFWAYVQGCSAVFTGILAYADQVASSEQFKNLLGTLELPKWVPIMLASMALITYIVHGHKDD